MDAGNQKTYSLDELRFKIDMHLLHDSTHENREIQAARLASLAKDFKDTGDPGVAIRYINRASHISDREEYRELLNQWGDDSVPITSECPYRCGKEAVERDAAVCEKCQRMLEWCPECGATNRLYERLCQWCGVSLPEHAKGPSKIESASFQWFREMELPHLNTGSIVVGDLLLVSDGRNGEIAALRLSDGECLWTLPDELPVGHGRRLTSCFPFVYISTSHGISRLMPGLSRPGVELLFLDSGPQESGCHAGAIVDERRHRIIFSGPGYILYQDYWRKKVIQRHLKLYGNDCVFPVIHDDVVYGLTRSGMIWDVSSEKVPARKTVFECSDAGLPVIAADGEWIIFEGTANGRRMLFAWSPRANQAVARALPDAHADEADRAGNIQPLVHGRGVLLTSPSEPLLIHARMQAGELLLREHSVNVRIQNIRVISIDRPFTSITGSYLVSRVAQGFFYINLDKLQQSGMEFFQSEMVTHPAFFQNKGLFLCSDGVRCYKLRE
ncbi:MAG: zinc ribbon domain-containing protein [Candidatus Thiodiazotropha sp. (ex Lucinoma borealis)]|nr:zinc ribbon domain-containing protein [Candidatus Thiodiazotropha sp. (ex Lucinoma borealis)]